MSEKRGSRVKPRRPPVRPHPRGRAPRDQHESAFASILAGVVARVPGAKGAALVDCEGETVDYAGSVDSFEMRLEAAHWRLVLENARAQPSLGGVVWIALRSANRTYLVQGLPEGYGLVVSFVRAASFLGWGRAVPACARALAEEARWDSAPAGASPWFPLEVLADARRRPVAARVAEELRPLEILGSLASGVGRRERGWRVRLDTGVETTLVREPGGSWYADEPLTFGSTAGPGQQRPGAPRAAARAAEENPAAREAPGAAGVRGASGSPANAAKAQRAGAAAAARRTKRA